MENNFEEDLYWDLKELNPDAIIYTEYHDAFMGFTLKNNKYVAVYEATGVEETIARNLMEDEDFLDDSFTKMDGKIKKSDLAEALSRLAAIRSLELSSNLLGEWDSKENYPVMFFMPKVIKADYEEGKDQIFHYEE